VLFFCFVLFVLVLQDTSEQYYDSLRLFFFFEQLQCEDAADQQCMAAAPPGKSELAPG